MKYILKLLCTSAIFICITQLTTDNRQPFIQILNRNDKRNFCRQSESNVRKMVSFDTRHALSTRNDKEKGIGAACNCESEFERYSKESGGKLEVNLILSIWRMAGESQEKLY